MQKTANMTHLSQTTIVSKEVTLNNGYVISAVFYNKVYRHAKDGVERMEEMRMYTLKGLCGEEFWESMNNREKRTAGRCFAKMVSHKVFDLKIIRYKRYATKRYLKLDDM